MGKTDDTKTGSGLMMTPSSTCFVKKSKDSDSILLALC